MAPVSCASLDPNMMCSGKRLFRKWLCHPLRRAADINDRYDAVEDFNNLNLHDGKCTPIRFAEAKIYNPLFHAYTSYRA